MKEFINRNKKLLVLGLCLATIAPAIGNVFASEVKFESGFVQQEENVYYALDKETNAIGWLKLENGTFYFDEAGVMQTGWQQINGYSYYFNEDGTMATGEVSIDDVLYNLQNDGKLLNGYNFTKTAYYDEFGFQIFGWYTVDGKEVFFKEDGLMAANEELEIEGNTYNFQEDGTILSGWVASEEVEGEWMYYDEFGFKVWGWVEIDGEDYYFNREGFSLTNTEYDGYSFDENGVATLIEEEEEISSVSSSYSENVASNPYAGSIVAEARSLIGKASYVYGAAGPNAFDCSGFTQYVYKRAGISIPRSSGGQMSVGTAIDPTDMSKWQAGDLVVYNGHVAIYSGSGTLIHAMNPSMGIRETYGTECGSGPVITVRRIS